MGQIKMIVNIVLISLFVIALITFSGNFGVDNETNVKLNNDSSFSSSSQSLQNNLTQFYTDANTSLFAGYQSTFDLTTGVTEGGTQAKVGFFTSLAQVKEVLSNSFGKIFGNDSGFEIFFSTFIALMGLIGGLYIYKTLRGNPD